MTASSSTLHNSNNTTTNNNNNNFNIHDDNGHHLHHLFITTKEKAAWMKAGPNNVPDVIWAWVSFLFSSFMLLKANKIFIVNIGCIYNIGERKRVGRPGTMETGPTTQDASFGPTSHQNHQQEKLGLKMQFNSSVGKPFCFLLYYFTNKF